MTQTPEAKPLISETQYITTNLFLASALLSLSAEFRMAKILYDKEVLYNKARFCIEFPIERREKVLETVSKFDQKILEVNLYSYNECLKRLKGDLHKIQNVEVISK